jgi:hypothetical protein
MNASGKNIFLISLLHFLFLFTQRHSTSHDVIYPMEKKKNKDDLKKGTSIALSPSLRVAAEAWAKANKVSLSAVLSASLEILLEVPLGRKELIVEEALRKAMNRAPSATLAQISRRLAILESEITQHRRPFCQGYCLPECVAAKQGLVSPASLQPTQPIPLGAAK